MELFRLKIFNAKKELVFSRLFSLRSIAEIYAEEWEALNYQCEIEPETIGDK
jgi:hypothetical protein